MRLPLWLTTTYPPLTLRITPPPRADHTPTPPPPRSQHPLPTAQQRPRARRYQLAIPDAAHSSTLRARHNPHSTHRRVTSYHPHRSPYEPRRMTSVPQPPTPTDDEHMARAPQPAGEKPLPIPHGNPPPCDLVALMICLYTTLGDSKAHTTRTAAVSTTGTPLTTAESTRLPGVEALNSPMATPLPSVTAGCTSAVLSAGVEVSTTTAP